VYLYTSLFVIMACIPLDTKTNSTAQCDAG